MSNSVFLFVIGLTLGILISLSLVNRYKSTHPTMNMMESAPHLTPDKVEKRFSSLQDGREERNANFEDFKGDTTTTPSHDISTSSVSTLVPPASSTSEEQTSSTEIVQSSRSRTKRNKPVLPAASSFWVPGKEGSYVKSSTTAAVAAVSSSLASGIESGMDKITDFFSGGGDTDLKLSSSGSGSSSSQSVGSIVAGGNSGATAALLMVQGGDEAGTEKIEGVGNEDEGMLVPGKGGLGGKKRRGKGRGKGGKRGKGRGGEGRGDDVDGVSSDTSSAEMLTKSKKSSKTVSGSAASETSTNSLNKDFSSVGQRKKSAGDDINLQSAFFNDYGERIDPFGSARLGSKSKSNKGSGSTVLYTHPPLVPYHSQAYTAPLDPPYVPSLPSVMAQRAAMLPQVDLPTAASESRTSSGKRASSGGRYSFPGAVSNGIPKALPNMTRQKGIFEGENLKLHLCNGVFEAYSASYLTTKEHMIHVNSETFNLTWVNCEMASFIHMKEGRNFFSNPFAHGMVIQSLDVLDLSVIHLSWYERSSKKYRHKIYKSKAEQKTEWTKIEPVKEAARLLEEKINPKKSGKPIIWSEDAKKTVVLMPFLGGAMGAGHSELGNRFEYLKACFWSFYEFIPNIVAGVSRQEDVDWCMKESGLPFYDILLLDNLPKGAGLPVGTTQRTKAKLQSGEWPFEYVFYTESDQILISRQLPMMYDHLKKYPGRMILPHRLAPYSDKVASIVHKKEVETIENNAWMEQSCCMPRQNCEERKTWKPIADPSVPVVNYYGLYIPLGNVNFLDELYRTCTLTSYIGDYCP